LPESYVLFFCRHDAYGKGEPAYVIERRCGAHPDLAVGDASPWVVLNASAWEARRKVFGGRGRQPLRF
ncbi:MAG: hypothetical protein ACLUE1_09525, partial [Adlercreutzia equolifaciens]